MKTWKELTTALSAYSTISTLVMFFHSEGGQVDFDHDPDPPVIKAHLDASGVKVTTAIRFEGCNIMLEPVTTAYIVSGIAAPGAVVSGYTHYSVFMQVPVPTGLPRDKAQELLDQYPRYWIPGTPTADAIAAATSEMHLWVRYFRDVNDDAPLPPHTPGIERLKGFVRPSELERPTLSSAEATVKLQGKEREAQGHSAALVTVTNIAAVAAKYRP